MLSRRRFRRRPPTAAVLGLAIVAVVGARLAYVYSFPPPDSASRELLHEGPCEVVKVVNGQTLLVRQAAVPADGREAVKSVGRQVRLLGIETDQPAAAKLLETLIADQECRLKFDKRRIDREGHMLAYVYAGQALVNERLVEEGLARASDYPGDSASIAKRLYAAQSKAKAAKRGLWAADNL